jgi:hypothetical protein
MESLKYQLKQKLHQQFLQFQIVERNFQFVAIQKNVLCLRLKASKLVPIIFIPYLDNFSANFKAVCPPSCTITPSGFHVDNIVDMFPKTGSNTIYQLYQNQ